MQTVSSQVHLVQHPVLLNKLFRIRNKDCPSGEFREVVRETSRLLAFEATRDLIMSNKSVETPMEKSEQPALDDKVTLASILRAGNGMLDGISSMMPYASIGHIGIYRNKFMNTTIEYFMRLPDDVAGRKILLLDPMLATGGTASAAISRLKDYDVGPIRMLCLLAAPEGIERVQEAHPDVEIYTLSIDRELNEKGYILPGLGDAGDRLYGTA